jgi:hypothetical protein
MRNSGFPSQLLTAVTRAAGRVKWTGLHNRSNTNCIDENVAENGHPDSLCCAILLPYSGSIFEREAVMLHGSRRSKGAIY